jgi:GNAT superfamily N-acetyltransferase
MAPDRTSARLVDPGAMLAAAHELEDGVSVRLRLTRPTDADRVRAFLEGLSPETRARRFLAPAPAVSEAVVRHFTFYDPRERIVVAATQPIEGKETIVGLADAAFVDDDLAEVGVVVRDEMQRPGLEKLLSEAMASLALRRGVRRLKAEMPDGDRRTLGLQQRLGETVRRRERGHAVAYTRLRADRRLSTA